jgi:ATP-dependent RNA helicase DDX3X
MIGRTGRIGNLGIATSFYNERDEDLAEELVKTLLETGQEVPDFLLEHVPEGGADAKLVFAADSDFEDEGEVEVAGATEEATNNVRDVQAGSGSADPAPAPATSGWGASTHDAVASGWGAPTSNVPALAIPVAAAPVASGWNTAVPVPPTASGWGAPPPASFGWGAPTSIPPVFHVIAPVVEPAAPVVASDGWSVPAAGTGWDAPAAPAPGWGSAPPGW